MDANKPTEGKSECLYAVRQDPGSDIDDPILGTCEPAHSLPEYCFPECESRPDDIYRVVSDKLYLDGNTRQNLAMFCQSWEPWQGTCLGYSV